MVFEMSGNNESWKVDSGRRGGESCPPSSSSVDEREPGNTTFPTPSGWLHLQNWKLKRLLEEKDTEIERLKTLLSEKDAENGILTEKLNRMEAELVSEVEISGDLVVELVEVKEEAARKLMEKDARIHGIKKILRGAEIQNDPWTSGLKAALIMHDQTDVSPVQEEKILLLFPEVLKIIIKKERKSNNCVHWRSLLPILTACRLVCKSWKESTDLIMEQDSSHTNLCPRGVYLFQYKRNYTPSPFHLSYGNFDNFRWNDKLKILPRELRENPSYNPIPTRHLMIDPTIDGDSEKWRNYCRMVARYLQVLGRHVWHLSIVCKGSVDESRQVVIVCRWLLEWLQFVPNLKSLSLDTPFSWTWTDDIFGFHNYLDNVSFPKFKDLVTFQVSPDFPFTYQILRNNRHIKNLEIPTTFSKTASGNFLKMDFPNLAALKCNLHSPEDWEKLLKVTWRLEDLSVGYFSKTTVLSTKTFFEGLQKFENTLQSLTFSLTQEEWGDNDYLKLNLPLLKRLRVFSHGWEPVPLEKFLDALQLKNLETFSMELSVSYGDPSSREITTFLEYVNEFHGNSDWNKFHKLRNVEVAVHVNGHEIGEPVVFEPRRQNMLSVRFDIVKIKEVDIYFWDQLYF